MDKEFVCDACKNPVAETYFFCPYCGKKLKEPPLSTSAGKLSGMFLLAVFFPLLAIVPGIRYVNQSDEKSKAAGAVMLLIAGICLMIEVYLAFMFYEQFGQILSNSFLFDYVKIN